MREAGEVQGEESDSSSAIPASPCGLGCALLPFFRCEVRLVMAQHLAPGGCRLDSGMIPAVAAAVFCSAPCGGRCCCSAGQAGAEDGDSEEEEVQHRGTRC